MIDPSLTYQCYCAQGLHSRLDAMNRSYRRTCMTFASAGSAFLMLPFLFCIVNSNVENEFKAQEKKISID